MRARYGIYFSAADPYSFILFADFDGVDGVPDKKYNHASEPLCNNSECIEKIIIPGGDGIKDVCGIVSETPEKIKKCSRNSELDYANIVFVRPDPDANIIGTLINTDTVYQSIEISVEPPKKDFCKTIKVWLTGQISIEPTCS